MTINQAVLFTKPVHHLGSELSPDELNRAARHFFQSKGLSIVHSRRVSGPELAECEIIRQHYLMYSKASYGDIAITEEGRNTFFNSFGKSWDAEVAAGRIMGNPELMESRNLDAQELFDQWNRTAVKKIQSGLLMGWSDELECYCINAFYPVMEANFYHPDTRIDYHVVEFKPEDLSWMQFRKEVLGATNAAKAVADSFRGQLYARYKVACSSRDNFVHGSAGPLEGLVERAIHENDFDFATNPVGRYLETLGVNLDQFKEWKLRQPLADLGALFDATEEKDTDTVFPILDGVLW